MGTDTLITKYRPRKFSDVIGQDAVVESIRGVVARRTAQAFLFAGPSGVGKTTLARIAARALGCSDDAMGIVEVNAALRTGVGDIRDVIGASRYALGSNSRAFIIDEAHRLSPQAFDGMLKALEESPRGVYWMLCTTAPASISRTIKTRCVTYRLKPVPTDLIRDLLRKVRNAELFRTPADVLDCIAEHAEGSPRQALSFLSACSDAKTRDEAAGLIASAAGGNDALTDEGGLVLSANAPLRSAEAFIEREFMRDGQRTILRYRGDFYWWTGRRYRAIKNDDILIKRLYRFLDRAATPGRQPFSPTPAKVNAVAHALRACAAVSSDREIPCWLGKKEPPAAPDRLIALRNGLFDARARRLIIHTPRFFNVNALPFAYRPNAPKPTEWHRFLDSLWPDDDEAKQTLQEVMGYLLTRDTRQQKIFLLYGPRRSGKGTIARALTALLGKENVANQTLSGLNTNFGLWPLIGKQLAIVSDARLGPAADQSAITERLLSISGEDALTIDRKNKEHWTGRLGVRFLILTNELPRIKDASGALASRFVTLTMTRSFYGREDLSLFDRISRELPGVLNWALRGLQRLDERGHLIMPQSSIDAWREIEDLSSPLRTFVRESCTVAPGRRATIDALYSAYIEWCKRSGERPGTRQVFGRDLKALLPHVRRREGTRADFYDGIGLKER